MENLWVIMDGKEYQLPVEGDIVRAFDFLDGGQGGMMQSGLETLDTIGTRYSYSVTIPRMASKQTVYDAFFQAVTSPNRVHAITLPYAQGTLSFNCKIENGSDRLGPPAGSVRTWGGLTLNFTPIRPQRTPETEEEDDE